MDGVQRKNYGERMSNFSFTKVAVIESLGPNDRKTGTELSKAIDALRGTHPGVPRVDLVLADSRKEFLDVLESLAEDAEKNAEYPILQIETHGWDDKMGLALADGTSVSWGELAAALVRINRATGFNLVVCVAACFGGHFLGALNPTSPSPCFAMIGPTETVGEEELLDGFQSLYRTLLLTLNADSALKALLGHQLDEGRFLTMTAEDWFFSLSGDYLRTHCTKERLRERGEAIIEQVRQEGKELNSAQQLGVSKLGEELAFGFLDRRFPSFFMTNAIPENLKRFSSSLVAARQHAREFFDAQR
jgi:hypothetical protein